MSSDAIADPAHPSSDPSAVQAQSYPNGHLGHLTQSEEEALNKFRAILEERGYWKPGPPASHDDPTLLRFLRARRWVPEDAFTQFKDTEDWRVANDIDVLYRTIEIDAYEQSRRLYPQWIGRRDRRGIPVYVYEVKPLDAKTVSEYERLGNQTFSDAKTDGKTPSGMLRLFSLYENLTRFNQPLCTQFKDRQYPEVPITMCNNVVDISGVGLKQFWNLKTHMQAASQLATAYYPETLDRIFIIGAPMFFNTVWGWIKRWFDPITVSKIFILSDHEVKPTLESFIDIKNIPKKYGGELDFEFGKLPLPDPEFEGFLEWENGHTSFPTGPLLWEEIDGGKKMACVLYGQRNGKKVHERICTIPKVWPPVPHQKMNGVVPDPEVLKAVEEQHSSDDTIANGDELKKLDMNDKAEQPASVPAAPAA